MKHDTTFVGAMLDFFGRKESQSLQDFAAEIRALSAEEKAWFRAELERFGYTFRAVA